MNLKGFWPSFLKKNTDIHVIHSQQHIVLLLTPLLTSSRITELQLSYGLVLLLQAHNFWITVHLVDGSNTADYIWDSWAKPNEMTFPHPVWMSWRLIPSKEASPCDIEPAVPPPHLCPQTPQSRTELSQPGCHGDKTGGWRESENS